MKFTFLQIFSMKTILILTFLLLFNFASQAGNSILEKLQNIKAISNIQKMNVDGFKEYYLFWFEQPVNHKDPQAGTFKQKVMLGHKKENAPVIAELEGYRIWKTEANELTELLKGNQLSIEHRFFAESTPEPAAWEFLTIEQAAADHHNIIQAIKNNVYPQSQWLSTGVSKGGQAAVFHRYFYPDDVTVSVPYVAPLNLEYIDPRIDKYLQKLGTNKTSVKNFFAKDGNQRENCAWMIRDFQYECFKNIDQLSELLANESSTKAYEFDRVGGIKRAMQLIILEYPFAFWQWGTSCADIPAETGNPEQMYKHLTKVSPPTFFEDKHILDLLPFFYSVLTEIGMYAYDIKPFKKYLNDKENITFTFAIPKEIALPAFNQKQLENINTWLQSDAEKILFVYGGLDPWSATAVELKQNHKCKKYIKAGMNHGCRIADFEGITRQDIIDTIKGWLSAP